MSDARRRLGFAARGSAFSGAVGVALVAILALAPLLLGGSAGLGQYGVGVLYVTAAIGLNIALGYSGEMAIGTATIMGVAAYAAGLSAIAGLPSLGAAVFGIFVGTGVGVLMVVPGLRVRGWYLALITLFSVMVLPGVLRLAEKQTGGEYGLTGLSEFSILGHGFGAAGLYELTVFVFAICWLGAANLARSGWGHRMRLLRDAPRAAEAVGMDLTRVRLVVYVLSSVPPAVAGVLLAYTNLFVDYQSFGIGLTLFLLTGVVLGGGGTIWGPIVGTVPLVILSLFVGPFSEYNAIGLAVGLLVSSLVFTNGIIPAIEARAGRRTGAAAPAAGARPVTAAVPTPPSARAGSGPAILASGLRKSFDGLTALSGMSFTLDAGRLCGLVGPNGCGKSTFLNALSGFISIDEGRLDVNGTAAIGLPASARAQIGVGRTFQVPQLVGDITVRENIEAGLVGREKSWLAGSLLRTPALRRHEHQRREAALAAFRDVGLPAACLEARADTLSLGAKRLVEIARAMAARPTLLLLDEPAAGLNREERQELGHLLVRLKNEGMTILVIEHDVPFVMQFCDEILLMQSGQVLSHAPVSQELPPALTEYLNYGQMLTRTESMAVEA